MSTMSDAPQGGFRLSQLIYDSRYRSLTIQAVAMILIMALAFMMVLNVQENLASKGRDFDFGFLDRPAGYQIDPALIEYDQVQSTHARAALVGIVNTLVVAFFGCILATVIGVVAGVLRLSKNWMISRLMSVYVEAFRNVPLLLWIVLIYAVVTESLPTPRDFGAGDASMFLGESAALTNRYLIIPAPVWGEGSMAVLAVFAISIVGMIFFRRFARTKQEQTGEILPVFWISLGILFVPAILAHFIMGQPITLDYPELGRFNFTGGLEIGAALMALTLALALYTGAFIAEIVRAGILAISKGQTEAAFALGIQPGRTMSLVVLPQALRVIIPPMISQFLNLTKNSSLALAVGYADVRATLGGTTINLTGKELEGTMLLGLFYLALSLLISVVFNIYNNSVKLKER